MRSLVLALTLLLGCSSGPDHPPPTEPTARDFAWPLGTWHDTEEGEVVLQVTKTHVVLTERLEARIKSVSITAREARFALTRGRSLVLRRKGKLVYVTQPTGIETGLVRRAE